jgi:ParB family chromosome partitioning protein
MDTRPQTNTVTELRLSSLKFGHEYPGGSINVRIPSEDDAKRMAASIAREGLLQPLLVVPRPGSGSGPFYTVIGGRRLAGLHWLRDNSGLDPSSHFPCMVAPDLGTAELLAKSLAAEDAHVPPHPVDRYDAFAALKRLGMTEPDIAARHFITERLVKQALALGELHEDIRKAWRAGEIGSDIAQLFTLADDGRHQVKTLDKLRKKFTDGLAGIDASTVRKFFSASEAEARKLLAFVGRDAYLAAGGRLTEDLFSGTDAEPAIVVHDIAKLKKLAEGKLEIEARRLTEGEGWSWAETDVKSSTHGFGIAGISHIPVKPDLTAEEKKRIAAIDKAMAALDNAAMKSGDSRFDYKTQERLEAERDGIELGAAMRSYTPAQKAKAGIVVSIAGDGTLRIKHGLVKPQESKSESGSTSRGVTASNHPAPKLTFEVNHDLQELKNQALTAALLENPHAALAALLASLGTWDAPINLQDLERSPRGWHLAFSDFLALKPDEITGALAMRAAEAVNIDRVDAKSEAALMAAIDVTIYEKHIAAEFNAKTFFAGCSKDYLLEHIEENLGADEKRRNAEKSQKQRAAFCLDSVAKKGWLPPELRGPNYKPGKLPEPPKPGAKAKVTVTAKKAKPAKKAKVTVTAKKAKPAKKAPAAGPRIGTGAKKEKHK